MMWHFIVVPVCISLMINDVDQYSIYLLTIYIFSLVKCLFKLFGYFFLLDGLSFYFRSVSILYILDTNFLSNIRFTNIFFHSMSRLLTFFFLFFSV